MSQFQVATANQLSIVTFMFELDELLFLSFI
jgi:hypothetical protein